MIRTGQKNGYWVVEWADGFDPNLADFVPRFPDVVLSRSLVIASCDSGPYKATKDEIAKGWIKHHETTVVSKVASVSELPMPGFDEWYVYAAEVPIEPHMAFVNRFGFSPLDELNPESKNFWRQVEQLQPLHVVGAGTPTMFLVTRDQAIFEMVCAAPSP